MSDTAYIIGILASVGVICGCVLISGRGLSRSRAGSGSTAYRATPAALRSARRALDHFGSYDTMERAAEKRADGVHVVHVPVDRSPKR